MKRPSTKSSSPPSKDWPRTASRTTDSLVWMMKVGGDPYVVEYNCRLGDPETEVIMPRIQSDLLHLFENMGAGLLSEYDLQIDPRTCSTVMLVSEGYPGSYDKGRTITLPDRPEEGSLLSTQAQGRLVVKPSLPEAVFWPAQPSAQRQRKRLQRVTLWQTRCPSMEKRSEATSARICFDPSKWSIPPLNRQSD